MSYRETASLSADLLAAKGGAAPATDVYRFGRPLLPDAAALLRRPSSNAAPVDPPSSVGEAVREATSDAGRKVKLSLRLTAPQHRRLRLLSAHLGLSHQALLESALERFAAQVAPEVRDGRCDCLNEDETGTGS